MTATIPSSNYRLLGCISSKNDSKRRLGRKRVSPVLLVSILLSAAYLQLFFQMVTIQNLLPDWDQSSNLASFSPQNRVNKHPNPMNFDIDGLQHDRAKLAHGTFHFGPDSHQVELDPTYQPTFNSVQQELLDDEIIDVQKEKERCARYNYQLIDEENPKRRRIFFGALLGDDSMEVLRAVGTEAYNIYHTVSFVEGNTTLNLSARKWKYYNQNQPSDRLNTLYQLFGPKTKVSVEYYVSTLEGLFGRQSDLSFENCQREGSTYRWALNGMRPDDIGIISDADEVFTRDYLRAMQVCDVPELRPNQSCGSKQMASTIVFESSPSCLTKDRRWWHPDAVLGECVEHVGNSSAHPPAKREGLDNRHGLPDHGHGGDNFSAYWSENGLEPESVYPLWMAADLRLEGRGARSIFRNDGAASGYHFHNFFSSAEDIHIKYHTYGHADSQAWNKPVWELHEDLQLAVDCANEVHREAHYYIDYSESIEMPIYYLNAETRNRRHELWKSIVKEEEELWNGARKHGEGEMLNSK